MPTIESNNHLELRTCALDGCTTTFKPTVYWQIYCTPKHAEKARKIRHKDKVKRALQMLDNYEAAER